MARVTEGVPGDEAEVWIQDKGGGPQRMRGTVVIEDLTGVLTCISSRAGANGPQSPVTQYILSEAANYLAERLVEDGSPAKDGRESVPRTLSSSLGHQPFIESVLNMSQHQMLRRWPLATDWYQDVINYVMRPARFGLQARTAVAQFDEWRRLPLGEFLPRFVDNVFASGESPRVFRMAEALQSLWPDYPPVREAMAAYRRQVESVWSPLYVEAMASYGLRLRPGTNVEELAWAFNALQSRENLERLADPDMPHPRGADGSSWTLTARSCFLVIAGAVTDEHGNPLSHDDLLNRMPID